MSYFYGLYQSPSESPRFLSARPAGDGADSLADAQESESRVTIHEGVCCITGEVTDSSSGSEENMDRTSQKCEEYERCSHEELVPQCQHSEMFRRIWR